jgi:pilus assembly protein Flp/PilA
MKAFLQKLMTDESGQDLIEYAIVAALVGLLGVGALKSLSNSVGKTFNATDNALTSAVS